MAKAKILIGRTEYIALPKLGVLRVQAKMDTGAYRSAIHYQKLRTRRTDGRKELVVTFHMGRKRVTMVFRKFTRVTVKSSNGETSRRYLVSTRVKLGAHVVRTEFTLYDRSDMKHQVLLGRKFLRGRFVVDVSTKDTLGRTPGASRAYGA